MKSVSLCIAAPLLAVLAGCVAPVEHVYSRDQIRERLILQGTCAKDYLPKIDDGVSDATTIAAALAQRCWSYYDMVTEAEASTLPNSNLKRMFVSRRNTVSERLENFLPYVLKYRADMRSQGRKKR